MLPFLAVVRNAHVLDFARDFFSALYFAKDILFSYLFFILIFAMIAISLFRDVVNEDSFADSFQSIVSAFTTGFVFISTTDWSFGFVRALPGACHEVSPDRGLRSQGNGNQ